jgi:hypothetical protein
VARRRVAVWVVTRLLLLALLGWPHFARLRLTGDPVDYHRWAELVVHGGWPGADPAWQYPPAAMAVLLVPLLSPLGYLPGLVGLVLGCDAVAALALAHRAGRPNGSARGLWAWLLVLPCAGPVVLARFDIVPAALAVGAASVGPPGLVGALVVSGALVKVWPAVLVGLPLRRRRRPGGPLAGFAGGAATAAVLAAGLAAAGLLAVSLRSFTDHQSGRGVQVESLAGYPAVLSAALAGHAPRVVFSDGSLQLVGHVALARATTAAAAAALVVTMALSLLFAARGAAASRLLDLGLAGLLVTVCCAEVLSPQYLVWLVALAAAATCLRDSRMGGVAVLLAPAALLTVAVFPYLYAGYLHAAVLPVVLEGLRDLTLLAATALALRRLRWSLPQRPDPPGPASARLDQPGAVLGPEPSTRHEGSH